MAWYEILIVSVGLSLDVFTYALYKGAMLSKLNKKADPENDSAVHRLAERGNALRKPDLGASLYSHELSED